MPTPNRATSAGANLTYQSAAGSPLHWAAAKGRADAIEV